MNALVVLALLLPLVGAVAAAVAPVPGGRVAPVVAGLTAAGWAIVAAADRPPTVGQLTVDPLVAVTAAGVAWLAATTPPSRALGWSAALAAVTVVAVGGAADDSGPPLRALAAATLVAALLVVSRARGDGAPTNVLGLVLGGGVAAAAGLLVDGGPVAAGAALAGTALVLVAAVEVADAAHSVVALVPVVLLAVARTTAEVEPDDASVVVWVGMAAGAVVLAVAVRSRRRGGGAVLSPSLALLAAAPVLLAADLPAARPAGLLAAAAGVLAAASPSPLAVAAAAPAIAALVPVAGAVADPVHLGAAAVLAGLALAAATAPATDRREPPGSGPAVTTALALPVALVFAVVPVWGWAGADLGPYRSSVGVALAVAFVTLVAGRMVTARADGQQPRDPTAGAPDATGRPAEEPVVPVGRLSRRQPLRAASRDGTTHSPDHTS